MKPTLLLFTVVALMAAASPLQKHTLEDAIEKADFVGYVVYEQQSNTPGMPWIRANEVFKGALHRFKMQSAEMSMNWTTEYLLVISFKHDEQQGTSVSDIWYPIKGSDTLTDAELTILDTMPCYSEALKKQLSNGGCNRVYEIGSEYCGCNNENYSGLCEMRHQGFLRAKRGVCP